MKVSHKIQTIVFVILMIGSSFKAQNPILPIQHHIPDPSAKIFDDGKLYIFGSLDLNNNEYCSTKHYVVSTNDMKEWKIDTSAFAAAGEHDEVPYSNQRLCAPDAEQFGDQFYLYYCQHSKVNAEGVAISNKANGRYVNGVPIKLGKTEQIDPSVFVDHDGQAYYMYGQFTLKMAKLNDDHTTLDLSSMKDSILTESDHYFHEGAYLTKRDSLYYLVYADISRGGRPTCLGYATSKTIFGPYAYRGVIIDNDNCDPAVWNNHGSIIKYHDQWYVFYHRSSQGTKFMRRMCAEPIHFSPDGSIPEVEMTSQGTAKPLNPLYDIEAERACLLYGHIRLQPWDKSNEALTEIHQDDHAGFKYLNFEKGNCKSVEFRIKRGTKPGKIILHAGKIWGDIIAVVDVPASEGNNEWINIAKDIKKVSGIQALWLTFKGVDGEMFSVDKFKFSD